MIVLSLFFAIFFSQLNFCSNTTQPLDAYHYNNAHKDYAIIHNKEIAVLVVAYNRPDYFKECIHSLEQNPQSEEFVFVFALDGGPHATQQENTALIQQSSIKNKIILQRERNYGCPKNHIDSKRFVFEWCKFKKVIVLEDDVVITPSYFTFILNCHAWAQKQYDNIGAVQGWSACTLSVQEKKKCINILQENPDYWSFLTYCIDDACWQKIRSILYAFEDFIDQIPITNEYEGARSKPCFWNNAKKINIWVLSLMRKKRFQKNIFSCPLATKLALNKEFISPTFMPAQDVIMGFAFYLNDIIKLQPIVNRALHIGEKGISTDASCYDAQYKSMRLDIFEQDNTMVTFQIQ